MEIKKLTLYAQQPTELMTGEGTYVQVFGAVKLGTSQDVSEYVGADSLGKFALGEGQVLYGAAGSASYIKDGADVIVVKHDEKP